MEEKRHLSRFQLRFPARIEILKGRIRSDGTMLNLKTRDISSGGAFIETRDPLPQGTEVKVEVLYSFPKSKCSVGASSLVRTEGMVSRAEPDGMAVVFRNNYKMIPMGRF